MSLNNSLAPHDNLSDALLLSLTPGENVVPSVLIIEDFNVIRELLCELLSDSRECVAVRTAEEGLRLLASCRFDAIITDVKLPGMDGAEFLRRARRQYPGVPVIVISGGYEGLPAEAFLDEGAFDYLLKPFTFDEVRRVVDMAVSSRMCASLHDLVTTEVEL
jgi:DNA-binding response OmpR family regulator